MTTEVRLEEAQKTFERLERAVAQVIIGWLREECGF